MRSFLTIVALFIFSATIFLFFNSCKKKREELIITPTGHPITYSVVAYFVTPTDKSFNPDYYIGVRACVLRLQAWYKSQMDNNKTFVLNPVVVDTLSGLHNSAWYNADNGLSGTNDAYAFFNTKYEMKELLGANFDSTHYTYLVFVAADFPDETVPRGFGAEGLADIQGLSGSSPERWMGFAGHALGHAFGLPEPVTVNPEAIMSEGASKFPHCILMPDEIDSLNASPFFQ